MDIATGDYIGFVDSDDFINHDMYGIMIEALERTHSDIATCASYIYKNDQSILKFVSDGETILSSEGAVGEILKGGLIGEAAWSKIYKKELFAEIRFPVGEINEDIPVMPLIFKNVSKIVCTGKPLYYYCSNPGSITHTQYNEKTRIVIKHIKEVSAYIEREYPSLAGELREFKGRYARNFCIKFEISQELKTRYKADYKFYKKLLKENVVGFYVVVTEQKCRKSNIFC